MENVEVTPGDRLKMARMAVGMSQSELAAHTGLPIDSIQNWEANRYLPKWDKIIILCDALETSPSELMGVAERK